MVTGEGRYTTCLAPECGVTVPCGSCWCWEHLAVCHEPEVECEHPAHLCDEPAHYCDAHK